MSIRVLIVDHQPLFRAGIRAVLESQSGIEVIGEPATADEALEHTGAARPDVMVIDIGLPGDAIGTIRTIRERSPKTQVLVLTSHATEECFRQAAAAGAVGYVLKDIEPVNLAKAIRATYAGRTMLSPTIAAELLHRYSSARPDGIDSPSTATRQAMLTANEVQVLTWVAQGLSDRDIARKLFLSESAVKSRLRNLYQRLEVRNRAQAAIFAVENGFVRPSRAASGAAS
ncbi:MAG TPA: response regulator transcription factor [bacterium]|nr:response regulator transcription factor [bacterium]